MGSRVKLTNIHCVTWASYVISLSLGSLSIKSGMMVANANTNWVMYAKCLARYLSSINGTLCCLLPWSLQTSGILAKAAILVTVSLLGQSFHLLLFSHSSLPFADPHCYHQAKPQHLLSEFLQPSPIWSPISPWPSSNLFSQQDPKRLCQGSNPIMRLLYLKLITAHFSSLKSITHSMAYKALQDLAPAYLFQVL